MCVCVCVYTHIYIYAHIYTHSSTFISGEDEVRKINFLMSSCYLNCINANFVEY